MSKTRDRIPNTDYGIPNTEYGLPHYRLRLTQDAPRRIRYIPMRWKKRRDEGATRSDLARHEEKSADRLKGVLSRDYDFGDQNPEEVEARLRNMIYGTSRK